METLLLTLLLSLFVSPGDLINTDTALGEQGKTPADGGITTTKHAYAYSDYDPDNDVENYVDKNINFLKLRKKSSVRSPRLVKSDLEYLLFPTRLKRSADPEDQSVDSAIVSVQYTDKSGRLKTLKGNADKLLIKRRRPNKGNSRKHLRRRKHHRPPSSSVLIAPPQYVLGDEFYDYEYNDYDDFSQFSSPPQRLRNELGGYFDEFVSGPRAISPVGYKYNSRVTTSPLNQKYSSYSQRHGYHSDYGHQDDYDDYYTKPEYHHHNYPENNFVDDILPSIFNPKKSYYRPKFGYPKVNPKKGYYYEKYSPDYNHHHHKYGYQEQPQYREIDDPYLRQPLDVPDPNTYYQKTPLHLIPTPTPQPPVYFDNHHPQTDSPYKVYLNNHYQPTTPKPYHYQPTTPYPHHQPTTPYSYHQPTTPYPYHHSTTSYQKTPTPYSYHPPTPKPIYYTESPIYRKAPPNFITDAPYYQDVHHHDHHHPHPPPITATTPPPPFPPLDTVFRKPTPTPSPLIPPTQQPPIPPLDMMFRQPPPTSTPPPSIMFEDMISAVETPVLSQVLQNSLDASPTFSALIAGPNQAGQTQMFKPAVIKDAPAALNVREAERKIDGRAYGSDYVGSFEHHTGTLGPFGFYANFYDEK